jgi:hypothetical protein
MGSFWRYAEEFFDKFRKKKKTVRSPWIGELMTLGLIQDFYKKKKVVP